jgi:transcriptional regulator with XRE-family HTH domain
MAEKKDDPVPDADRIAAGFGRRLAALREQAGAISQKELAARSGVPQPRIAEYELGKRLPTWPNVVRLALALGQKKIHLVY